jgi:hypothetical protein
MRPTSVGTSNREIPSNSTTAYPVFETAVSPHRANDGDSEGLGVGGSNKSPRKVGAGLNDGYIDMLGVKLVFVAFILGISLAAALCSLTTTPDETEAATAVAVATAIPAFTPEVLHVVEEILGVSCVYYKKNLDKQAQ